MNIKEQIRNKAKDFKSELEKTTFEGRESKVERNKKLANLIIKTFEESPKELVALIEPNPDVLNNMTLFWLMWAHDKLDYRLFKKDVIDAVNDYYIRKRIS